MLAFCAFIAYTKTKVYGNHAANQRFCFHYIESIIPLHPKSFKPLASLAVQPNLCQT